MRTQIALEPQQHAMAKQKAATMGISMAEYIRRLVDRDLDPVETVADPAAIIGIGRSGDSDIATEGKRAAVAAAVAEQARGR